MPEFGFYHLTRSTLEDALFRLLQKALEAPLRAVVRTPLDQRLDQIDRALWTTGKDSFLPHGTMRDGDPDRQPVYLTTGLDIPNGAELLVLLDDAPADDAGAFARVVELFDGRDAEALARARERWRWAGERGFERVYWQQDPAGRWRRAGA